MADDTDACEVPIADVQNVQQGRIWQVANVKTRQDADIADFIWSVRGHVLTLTHAMKLAPGNIISGVGTFGT